MSTTWEECTLADALVAPWPVVLGVHRAESGKVTGHPVPWRLWLSVPSKPKAPPIVITPRLALIAGARCVAFTDVEASLMCAAVEAGAFDAERLVELARQRQTEQLESRVRPFRWLDACDLAGVDPWAVARNAKLSLGRVLAALGCEAVRLEVQVASAPAQSEAAA